MSDDVTEEIRARTDLVALIGEYVSLKRAGQQFKGLCPFHSEKSPSFHVHPERQFFHCFGCGASGDCFSFVQKLEGRSFPEAKRFLAERAGIEIAPSEPGEEQAHKQARLERERLLAVMETAAGYYVKMLAEHPLGAMARAEIAKRGVSPEVAATYRLGYAPHGWDHLARLLAQKGFSPRDAEHAGMIVPRRTGEGHYDRFRHRLMFPIADVHGKIVAFSGRILAPPPDDPPREGQDPPAKYVNSPEGPLYKKGELLFGLHEARVELRREGTAVLCEGNFDVLALHQAGCRNVVAPLGTAFTSMQAKLLRRYVSRVTLVFDGDRAGAKAVAAAFPLLMAEAIATKVAALPAGEDPDSYLRARGDEALRALVAGATPIVEHLIESAAAEAGSDPAARSQAIEALGPVIAAVPNPVERGLWIERIAQAFAVSDVEAVRQQMRRGLRAQRGDPRGERRPTTPDSAPKVNPEAASKAARDAWMATDQTEKDVVVACLDQPDLLRSSDAEKLDALLTSADLRVILRSAARMVDSRGVVDATALLAAVGRRNANPGNANPDGRASTDGQPNTDRGEGISIPARTWLEERLSVQTFDEAAAKSFLGTAIRHLTRRSIEREMRALEPRIKQALRDGDHELLTELYRLRQELFRSAAAEGNKN